MADVTSSPEELDPIPADLFRVDVIHDIPEEEKQCDCGAALSCIGQLYQIEKEADVKNLEPIQIYRLRQEKAKPVLEAFKTWLITKQQITSPRHLRKKPEELKHGYP